MASAPPPIRVARRLQGVLDPVIPRVGALMAAHPDCLSLAQGMVDWGPPPAVLELLLQELARAASDADGAADLHRYGPLQGDPPLLAAIERQLRQQQLDLEGSALLVTAGSNMAFQAIVQVLCEPGDEVILPVPWYFNHVMAVQLAGAIPVRPQAGLLPDPHRLAAAITPRCRAIVTVSPNNPSGLVIPPQQLAEINRLCAERGLLHISDEAYAAFVHGGVPHVSPAAVSGASEHTVTLRSLSKSHGMAGWRVGYAAVPRRFLPALAKVQDTCLICPPRLVQRAAVAALTADGDWLQPRLARLGQRRRLLLRTLEQARNQGSPLRLRHEPDGAFYALLQLPWRGDGMELVAHLIRAHGVAALPGESFGLPTSAGWATLRLSYGLLPEQPLAVALQRLLVAAAELPTSR